MQSNFNLAEEMAHALQELPHVIDLCQQRLAQYESSPHASSEVIRHRQQHLLLLERIFRLLQWIHRHIPLSVLRALAGLIGMVWAQKELSGAILHLHRNDAALLHTNPCFASANLEVHPLEVH